MICVWKLAKPISDREAATNLEMTFMEDMQDVAAVWP